MSKTSLSREDVIELCQSEPVLRGSLRHARQVRSSLSIPAGRSAASGPKQETVWVRARRPLHAGLSRRCLNSDVYGEEIDMVDSLKPGEIPVLCCHGITRVAPWGELLSTRSKVLGAPGLRNRRFHP
jgi:hypothetical protein